MNTTNQTQATPVNKSENVLAGIVGAFLFALVGGILWFILDRVDFVAGISGIVGVIAANRGYTFFAKGSSKKGIIISSIIAILVLVLAWYLCFSLDLYQVHEEWYANGEIDYMPTYFECVASGYLYFSDAEIAFSYIKILLIGLALAVVSTIPTFKQLMQNQKIANEAPIEADYTYNTASNTETPETANEEKAENGETDKEEPKQENAENGESN